MGKVLVRSLTEHETAMMDPQIHRLALALERQQRAAAVASAEQDQLRRMLALVEPEFAEEGSTLRFDTATREFYREVPDGA